jgi:alpha-beta hydrolase superfamily lysophospholipase
MLTVLPMWSLEYPDGDYSIMWQRMFVEVNGARLYFDVEGAGLAPDGPRMMAKPTLILLHGRPGFDHTSYKPAFSTLADIVHIIYVDQRGHGRSTGGDPKTWNLAQWGDDAKAFCDVLGIEKPTAYMAHRLAVWSLSRARAEKGRTFAFLPSTAEHSVSNPGSGW